MEHGDLPRLVLTITRACNLRCGFCPLELGDMNMTPEVAAKAVALYKERFPGGRRHVRIFGGEPLLRFELLRRIVAMFPNGGKEGGAHLSFPTNGTLIDREVVSFLRAHPRVEAAVSRVRDVRTIAGLKNALVSVCIPPSGAKDAAAYVARLLRAGLTRFNFLPAFYVRWAPEELKALERAFRVVAGLIREWEARGHRVEVRNLSTFNPVPLYNHGMVVDYSGEVFPSNAVLCGEFRDLREEMRMGTVLEPEAIDWRRGEGVDWNVVIRDNLDRAVYDSTLRVNDLLTTFVRELKRHGSGHAPAVAA